jgi:GNAT superfamily N-acetyltransferase
VRRSGKLSSSDRIRLQELRNDLDPEFRAVIRLYERAFAEGEKESLDSIRSALSGPRRGAPRGDRYHVVVARAASGRVVGGAFFHYIAAINAGFLGYLFVQPSQREHGIGRRLLRKVEATLRRDASQLGYGAPIGLFLELKKADAADPANGGELRFWRVLGVMRLNLDWRYPRLRDRAGPLDMWLGFRAPGGKPARLTRPTIKRAVAAIHRSVYGSRTPARDPMVSAILGSIRGISIPWSD